MFCFFAWSLTIAALINASSSVQHSKPLPMPSSRWAVGNGGLVLRDSGAGWFVFLSSNAISRQNIMLYGESSPLLGGNYLLGDSCSFRDSGGGWQTVNSTRFLSFGVAKFGPNIIACGAKGGIGQWNSSLSFWNVFPGYQGTNDLLAISADSSGAFWIVGRNGTVLCIDNNLISISIVTFPYKVDLYSVACLSDTEGWVVGGQGTIVRYTAGRVLSQASGAMTLSVSWAIES